MPKTKTKRTPRKSKVVFNKKTNQFRVVGPGATPPKKGDKKITVKGDRPKKPKAVGVPGMIKKFLDGTKLKGSARDRLEFDLFMKQLEFGGKKRGGKVKNR